jgi:hypothetical protein
VARDGLHVVAAAAEHARILVAPGDAGAAPLLVHVEQDVLVVAEIMPIGDRVPELQLREMRGGLAGGDLVELGQRLGQIGIDAEALNVAPHHVALEIRRDVPPLRRIGMRAADEHTRRGRQRLIAYGLAARLRGAGANIRSVALVDEADLVDAALGGRDGGAAAIPGDSRRSLYRSLMLAAPGEWVEERHRRSTRDDGIGDRVRMALIGVARLIDTALELHSAALLDDVRGLVRRRVQIRRRSERDGIPVGIRSGAEACDASVAAGPSCAVTPEMSWWPNKAWIRSWCGR